MTQAQVQGDSHLAGAVPKVNQGTASSNVQPNKYPRWIDQKFTPEGALLPFPGHTVICHVAHDSPLFQALSGLYDALRKQPFASLCAFLPPTSWHMTVFEGVSSHIREAGVWPADVPLDAPLEDCTSSAHKKLESFDLQDDTPFRMRIEGFEPLLDGIALKVVPADEAVEKRLRGLRDRLSECLVTRHPGHDEYSFHISVSYMLRFLGGQEERDISAFLEGWRSKLPETFELGVPEFCTFDDMFAFRRVFYLARRA